MTIGEWSVLMVSGRHLLNLSFVVLCPLFGVPLQAQIPPAFQPEHVAPPKDAGYLIPDGSIRVVGLDDVEGIVTGLNALFAKTHPGTRFTYVKGNSLAAIYSLIFDATAFAPAAIVYPSNLTYTDIVHGAPLSFRVAHGSLNPVAKVSGLAIIVNKSNPIKRLTMAEVGSIFTQSARGRVLTHWSQLGTPTEREIHPIGLPWTDHYPSEDLTFGEYFFFSKLGGAPPVRNYTFVKRYDDVVSAVSIDPDAIGVTALNRVTDAVRVVPVSDGDLRPPMTGTSAEISSGKYPLDRDLYLYVRVVSGKPIDPFVAEYLRMMLSREGQEIIRNEAHGYIPLSPLEATEELANLQ
jgi:phosphate transport system substrate-binding protein